MRGSIRLSMLLVPLVACGCGRSARSDTPLPSASAGAAPTEEGGGMGAGGAGPGGARSSVVLEGAPIYTRVQRLTVAQWSRAVQDLLHLEAPPSTASFQPVVEGTTDFTNNERLLTVDPRGALDFEAGAEAAASLATASVEALARIYPGTDAAGFVSSFGRRAFRRPLSAEQQAKYETAFARGEALYGAGFASGAGFVIRAMLQSPYFLYRSELGPAGEPLDDYEAASKLSFWLLGTTPDDALLDAAEAGKVASPDALEAVARQMLERPAAVDVMRDFHRQVYHLGRFAEIEKPTVLELDTSMKTELAEVSYRFFDRIFTQGEGLREILTSERGFVGPALAPLYGLPAPVGIEEHSLGASRPGFFLQVPFLLLFSIGREPHAIARAQTMQLDVLCHQLGAEQTIVPVPSRQPNQTRRQRFDAFTADCGDCHVRFLNPLGFAFDAFDGLGQWQPVDEGQPVDTSGSYPFSDGERSFDDAQGLVRAMAESIQPHTCYAKRVSGYALQRDIVERDRPLLEELADVSRQESLKAMIIALVRNPAFRLRSEGTP